MTCTWNVRGVVAELRPGLAYQNIRDKIQSRVQVDSETGCWNWLGGQGVMFTKEFRTTPSRAAAIAWHIIAREDAAYIARICCNWKCVNPEHLCRRADERLRSAWEKRGVLRNGESHPSCKLSDADVLEIRRLAARGGDYFKIGARFGVNPETCRLIARHKTRRAVGGPITYRMSKISPDTAAAIRLAADNYFLEHHTSRGLSKTLAKQFSVTRATVTDTLSNRRWKRGISG